MSNPSAPPDPPATPSVVRIPAGSERQALDWSLALASQSIGCVIRPPAGDLGWSLEVDAPDAGRALRTLRLYHLENRRRSTVFRPLMGEMVFHWGVVLWCLLMVVMFWASQAPAGDLLEAGWFNTAATRQGQWWRPITATFLHSGPDHLAANLTIGFVLIGLTMGRFQVGPALLGTFLAGVGGNYFAWFWRTRDYTGLGASGVVMGALGMLAVSLISDAIANRISRGTLMRALLGGLLLFVLIGTSPESDVLAHLGGFLSGGLVGAILAVLPVRLTSSPRFDVAAAAAYLAISGLAWMRAVQ